MIDPLEVDPLDNFSEREAARYYGVHEFELPLVAVGFTAQELEQCNGREVVVNLPGNCWSQYAALLSYGVTLREYEFSTQALLQCDAKKIKALHNYYLTLSGHFSREELLGLSAKELDALWGLRYVSNSFEERVDKCVKILDQLIAEQRDGAAAIRYVVESRGVNLSNYHYDQTEEVITEAVNAKLVGRRKGDAFKLFLDDIALELKYLNTEQDSSDGSEYDLFAMYQSSLFSLSNIPSTQAIEMAKHTSAVQTIGNVYYADMCNAYDTVVGVSGTYLDVVNEHWAL